MQAGCVTTHGAEMRPGALSVYSLHPNSDHSVTPQGAPPQEWPRAWDPRPAPVLDTSYGGRQGCVACLLRHLPRAGGPSGLQHGSGTGFLVGEGCLCGHPHAWAWAGSRLAPQHCWRTHLPHLCLSERLGTSFSLRYPSSRKPSRQDTLTLRAPPPALLGTRSTCQDRSGPLPASHHLLCQAADGCGGETVPTCGEVPHKHTRYRLQCLTRGAPHTDGPPCPGSRTGCSVPKGHTLAFRVLDAGHVQRHHQLGVLTLSRQGSPALSWGSAS